MEHVWLEAIRQGAQAHLDLELRLRAYAVRAAQFLQAKRRPGRLKDMLLLAEELLQAEDLADDGGTLPYLGSHAGARAVD